MEPLDPGALSLTWHDITYDVRPPGGGRRGAAPRKRILHGLSGAAASGRLLALMGPSGAGKTSLVRESVCV